MLERTRRGRRAEGDAARGVRRHGVRRAREDESCRASSVNHPVEKFDHDRDFSGTRRRAQALTFGGGTRSATPCSGSPRADPLHGRLVVRRPPVDRRRRPAGMAGDPRPAVGAYPRTVVPGHGPVSGPEASTSSAPTRHVQRAKPGDPNPYPGLPSPEMWSATSPRSPSCRRPLRHAVPLLERTAEGEFGSWRAVDDAGGRYIVKNKWSADGVAATELLRDEGYPVPRYVARAAGALRAGGAAGRDAAGLAGAGRTIATRTIELNEQLAASASRTRRRGPSVSAPRSSAGTTTSTSLTSSARRPSCCAAVATRSRVPTRVRRPRRPRALGLHDVEHPRRRQRDHRRRRLGRRVQRRPPVRPRRRSGTTRARRCSATTCSRTRRAHVSSTRTSPRSSCGRSRSRSSSTTRASRPD